MRVHCTVEETTLSGDYEDAHGCLASVDGICVACSRCGHQVEVYGTSPRSVRRGLVMLRDECPRGESNYYVAADGSHED